MSILAGQDVTAHLELAAAPSQGQLFVQTRPAGAAVRVVNIKPLFSQGMRLAPGTYELDASLEGYRTAVQSVTLAPGERKTVTIDLAVAEPQGRLFVTTEPAGARVRILNIKPRFRQGMLLEEGLYTVQATLPGHAPVSMDVPVRPQEDKHITLQLPNTSAPGTLFVDRLPAGGKVRVMTVRPVFRQGMALRPGLHTLEITLPGEAPRRHAIAVTAGQSVHVDAAALVSLRQQPPSQASGGATPAGTAADTGAPSDATDESPEAALAAANTANSGRLFVETKPGNADVRILHISWSHPAPYVEGMLLPEGVYGVSAFKDGFDPVLQRVQVLAGKSTRLQVDLAEPPRESAAVMPARPLLAPPQSR